MTLLKGLGSHEPAPQPDRERHGENEARDDVDRLIASLAESVEPSSESPPLLWVPETSPRRTRTAWPRLRACLARRGLVVYVAAPILLGVVVGILAVRLL